MEWFDLKTILIIMHLFGVAIGAGGAFMSDILFNHIVKKQRITKSDEAILRRGSIVVWAGLGLLYFSGVSLFLLAPEAYLESSKFLVKITIVLILTINGIIFHFIHMPIIERCLEQHLLTSDLYIKSSRIMYVSGAISVVSWASALILGSLRSIPITYLQGMLAYLLVVCCAVIGALILRHRYFSQEHKV